MTPTQTRGDATRERLLVAAEEILAERGPSDTTLREIARRAGVSHGAPLRHFATLHDLLTELARDGFVRLHRAVAERVLQAGPGAGPRRRLAAAGVAYVATAVERPRVFELMFRADIVHFEHPELAAAGTAAFAQLNDLVAEAQRDGWNPTERTPVLAGTLWSSVHGLAQLWALGALGAATENASLDAQLRALFRALDLPPATLTDPPLEPTPNHEEPRRNR